MFIDILIIIVSTIIVLFLIFVQIQCKFISEEQEYCPELILFQSIYIYVPAVFKYYAMMIIPTFLNYYLKKYNGEIN